MANEEHLALLKQGIDQWNEWRQQYRDIRPDLSHATLSHANLSYANLNRAGIIDATLIHAHLSGANLSYANLSHANLSHANLSIDLSRANLSYADLSSAYLSYADLSSADLNHANLSHTYLSHANLSHANLSDVNLSHANLSHADLSHANLSGANLSYTYLSYVILNYANLSGANLSNANLSRSSLSRSYLSNADLSGANLIYADLISANLSGTTFSDATLSGAFLAYTVFAKNDLSTVKGLVEIDHRGPSIIQLHTVKLPQDGSALYFLRGAGIPEPFIEYLPSLLTTPIQYHSLFLSHSHFDQVFTQQLYKNLQNQGVRCWYAPHDLVPGRPIVRGIEEAIHLHEKLLLILSEHAVNSSWVELEVEAALHKEVTTKQEILFPLRLDNTVLSSNTLWAKRLRQRHIADFTNWQDAAAYQQAFSDLLRHLKANKPPTV